MVFPTRDETFFGKTLPPFRSKATRFLARRRGKTRLIFQAGALPGYRETVAIPHRPLSNLLQLLHLEAPLVGGFRRKADPTGIDLYELFFWGDQRS